MLMPLGRSKPMMVGMMVVRIIPTIIMMVGMILTSIGRSKPSGALVRSIGCIEAWDWAGRGIRGGGCRVLEAQALAS